MRKLWKEGERFTQDAYGPLGLVEVRYPPGVPWMRTSRSRAPGPDIHTHTHPIDAARTIVGLWILQRSIYPGTAKHWQAAAEKASLLLDPCLHCRIFTRRREGGKFMV